LDNSKIQVTKIISIEMQNMLGKKEVKMVDDHLMKRDFTILMLVLISSIGIAISLFVSSRLGIGISPDSVAYIASALNLLNGLGLSTLSGDCKPIPLTHFPPLFPLLLSSIGVLGDDPLIAVRWVIAFLFGANILLIGVFIHRINRSFWLSIFGILLILTSDDMVEIHIYACPGPARAQRRPRGQPVQFHRDLSCPIFHLFLPEILFLNSCFQMQEFKL
jgi:hypothetical protein